MSKGVHRRIACKVLLLGAVLTLLLGACRATESPREAERMIAFQAEWTAMRSGIVDGQTFPEAMLVTAFLQEANGTALGTLFQDLQVTKASGWNTGYPWMGGTTTRKLAFYAFAPYEALQTNWAERTYQLTNHTGETDIVAAEATVAANYGRDLTLHFHHLLAGLSFAIHAESPALTIHALTLQGIPSSGTYSLATKVWQHPTTPQSYQRTDVTHHTPHGADTPLPSAPLFLLPGTLPSGAKLIVELQMEGSSTREQKEISLEGQLLEQGRHYLLRLHQPEEGVPLTYEILPWERQSYKKGFLSDADIEMFAQPTWGANGTTLTDTDSRATLTFTFLRPLGVAWKATLTNGLDFAFEGVREGTTAMGKEFTLTVKPLKPQGVEERSTELYITLYGREIDPDKYTGGNGPIGIGKGQRYKIIQQAKQ